VCVCVGVKVFDMEASARASASPGSSANFAVVRQVP